LLAESKLVGVAVLNWGWTEVFSQYLMEGKGKGKIAGWHFVLSPALCFGSFVHTRSPSPVNDEYIFIPHRHRGPACIINGKRRHFSSKIQHCQS
jgi:hypothetical protein